MKKLKKKIRYLGINYDPGIYIFIRVTLTLVLFFYLVLSLKTGYIIAPLVSIIFYLLIDYIILDIPILVRKIKLEKEALDYIPALLLNLRSGKSIKVSIKNSSKVVNNELSREFQKVIDNTKVGLTIEESLKDLETRIPSIYIQNIIIDLKENIKYGTKVLDTIELQLSSIEDHYYKSVINKSKMLPIKLCLLSILFIGIMIFILVFYT